MKKLVPGTLLLLSSLISCQQRQETRPNIIYILADDLGYSDLGCYGQEKIETPNINELAARGMKFTNYYAGSPVSAPSRCITLTGLHSGHAYIRGNDEMSERGNIWSHEAMFKDSNLEGQRPMPSGTTTIASLLKSSGYRTGLIGKWGLGYPDSDSTPNKMGFDFFYGYNCQRQAHTYYPPFLYRNENREYLPNEILPPGTKLDSLANPLDIQSYSKYSQSSYSCDLLYNEAIKFINKHEEGKPFFMLWATPIPHVPLQAPEYWVNYYVEKFGDETPYTGESGYYPSRYPHATYAAMISYLDDQIGKLIQELKNLDIYNNTIIIITSDNGPTFNGGSDSPWFDSAHPFKSNNHWGKASLREGGIRVPMIATWGDKIKHGSISNHICAAWDVLPSLCELSKVRDPFKTDGISFIPELLNKKQETHEFLYWEYPERGGSKAIRMNKWKGLILNIKEKGEDKIMLFNLDIDPLEQNDVSKDYPEIVELMRKKMTEFHVDSQVDKFKM